jgi:DNA topoisomerase 2-associated protein PAT1
LINVIWTLDRDFDFAGATAKVADVIHEEQAVYTRSNTKKQTAKLTSAPVVSETPHLPALVPDMSLWGTSPGPTQTAASEPFNNESQNQPMLTAPAGKRFMSLEEVEAEILAMNQKPPQPPPPQQPQQQPLMPLSQPQIPHQQHIPITQTTHHQFQHQTPQPVPPSRNQVLQYGPPPVDLQGFPQQLPPHLKQMLQQNQMPQHIQQLHHDRITQQPLAQQKSQRINPREQQPVTALQTRNQYGMTTHIPAQHLQQMTEADRLRFLEEESKRLKRNHKIAQLVWNTFTYRN